MRKLLATMVLLAGAVAAQEGREPQPQPAIATILAKFDASSVVAIGDFHRTRDINDFVLALIRHPQFADKVNDIVVESTNSFLQPTLDKYVNGDEVPYNEARQLWREDTTSFGASDFKGQLFQLVRTINRSRPAQRRLRVIAAEAPVDWNANPKREPADMDRRERRIASVVETEVLAKRRKALMFYGSGHLRRDTPYASSVELIEYAYPGSVFVITPYVGVTRVDNCSSDPSVDARMNAWPVPSVVNATGWLLDLAMQENATRPQLPIFAPKPSADASRAPIDAYLYLGQPSLLLREFPSVFTFVDETFLDLLHQRQLQVGLAAIDPRTDPSVVAVQDRDMLRCAAPRN